MARRVPYEDTWGMLLRPGEVEDLAVPQGLTMRVSQIAVARAPHDTEATPAPPAKKRKGVKPSCYPPKGARLAVTCTVDSHTAIPLCTLPADQSATLEFVLPEGSNATFRAIEVPQGKWPVEGEWAVHIVGTLSANVVDEPSFDDYDDERVDERSEPSGGAEASKKRKRCESDSDATVEIDTLPRLPSRWSHMTPEQKREASRRIREGYSFKDDDSSNESESDDESIDDSLVGDLDGYAGGGGEWEGFEEEEEDEEDEEDY